MPFDVYDYNNFSNCGFNINPQYTGFADKTPGQALIQGLYHYANSQNNTTAAEKAREIFGPGIMPIDSPDTNYFVGRAVLERHGYLNSPWQYFIQNKISIPQGLSTDADVYERVGADFIKQMQEEYQQGQKLNTELRSIGETMPQMIANEISPSSTSTSTLRENVSPEAYSVLAENEVVDTYEQSRTRASNAWSMLGGISSAEDFRKLSTNAHILDNIAEALSDNEGNIDELALSSFLTLLENKAKEARPDDSAFWQNTITGVLAFMDATAEPTPEVGDASLEAQARARAIAEGKSEAEIEAEAELIRNLYVDANAPRVRKLRAAMRNAMDSAMRPGANASWYSRNISTPLGRLSGQSIVPMAGSIALTLATRGRAAGVAGTAIRGWLGSYAVSRDSLVNQAVDRAYLQGVTNPEAYGQIEGESEAMVEGIFNAGGSLLAGWKLASRVMTAPAARATIRSGLISRPVVRTALSYTGVTLTEGAGELAEEELSEALSSGIINIAHATGYEISEKDYTFLKTISDIPTEDKISIFLFSGVTGGVGVPSNYLQARQMVKDRAYITRVGGQNLADKLTEIDLTYETRHLNSLASSMSEEEKRRTIAEDQAAYLKALNEVWTTEVLNNPERVKQFIEEDNKRILEADYINSLLQTRAMQMSLRKHGFLGAEPEANGNYEMTFYTKSESGEQQLVRKSWTRDQLVSFLRFQDGEKILNDARQFQNLITANAMAKRTNAEGTLDSLVAVNEGKAAPIFAAHGAATKDFFEALLESIAENNEILPQLTQNEIEIITENIRENEKNKKDDEVSLVYNTFGIERDGSYIIGYVTGQSSISEVMEMLFASDLNRKLREGLITREQLVDAIEKIEKRIGEGKLLTRSEDGSYTDTALVKAYTNLAQANLLTNIAQLNSLSDSEKQLLRDVFAAMRKGKLIDTLAGAWKEYAANNEMSSEESVSALMDIMKNAGLTFGKRFEGIFQNEEYSIGVMESLGYAISGEQQLAENENAAAQEDKLTQESNTSTGEDKLATEESYARAGFTQDGKLIVESGSITKDGTLLNMDGTESCIVNPSEVKIHEAVKSDTKWKTAYVPARKIYVVKGKNGEYLCVAGVNNLRNAQREAKEGMVLNIRVEVLGNAEGLTDEDLRALNAIQNIQNDCAYTRDYAIVYHYYGINSEAVAMQHGFYKANSEACKRAMIIANHVSPKKFNKFVTGQIPASSFNKLVNKTIESLAPSGYPREAVTQAVANGENLVDAQVNAYRENTIEFNVVSARDADARKLISDKMKSLGYSKTETAAVLDRLDEMANLIEQFGNEKDSKGNYKYPQLRAWNAREVDRIKDGRKILPRVSFLVNNGDYPINFDAGTICVKREPLTILMDELSKLGYTANLGVNQIMLLNGLLQRYQIATGCELCFVDTKRTRDLQQASILTFYWNAIRSALGITGDAPIGRHEGKLSKEQMALINELRGPLTPPQEKDIKKRMAGKSKKAIAKERRKVISENQKAALEKIFPESIKRIKDYDLGLSVGALLKILDCFVNAPSIAGIAKIADFLETGRKNELLLEYGHLGFRTLVSSIFGSGTSKPLEHAPIYDETLWRTKTQLKKLQEQVKTLGGARLQSFSDYNPILLLDYYQMFLALEWRLLSLQTYTKVASFVETFGETRAKINMSLIPEIVDGVDDAHVGLQWNAKEKKWEPAWHKDSFPPDLAFKYRMDDKMHKNVGIVAVAISDAHLRVLLDDDRIDYIIPLHLSGMPVSVQTITGLGRARDYTSVQSITMMKDGKRVKVSGKDISEMAKDARFKHLHLEDSFNTRMRRLGDPKKAVAEYLSDCDAAGLYPAFFEFRDHPNYYKLLVDFRVYDRDGNYAPQENVKAVLRDGWQKTFLADVDSKQKKDKRFNSLLRGKIINEAIELVKPTPLEADTRALMVKRLNSAIGGTTTNPRVIFLNSRNFTNELDKIRKAAMGEQAAQQMEEIFLKEDATVYGFAHEGIIYLREESFNATTPAHEFTHIWAKVAQQANPKLWKKGVALLKETALWKKVEEDPLYYNLKNRDNAIASEVLARLVGADNETIIKRLVNPETKHLKELGIIEKIKEWMAKLWKSVRSLFDGYDGRKLTLDEFKKMPLADLWDETRNENFRNYLLQNPLGGSTEVELSAEAADKEAQQKKATISIAPIAELTERFDNNTLAERMAKFIRRESNRISNILRLPSNTDEAVKAIAASRAIINSLHKYVENGTFKVSKEDFSRLTALSKIVNRYAKAINNGTMKPFSDDEKKNFKEEMEKALGKLSNSANFAIEKQEYESMLADAREEVMDDLYRKHAKILINKLNDKPYKTSSEVAQIIAGYERAAATGYLNKNIPQEERERIESEVKKLTDVNTDATGNVVPINAHFDKGMQLIKKLASEKLVEIRKQEEARAKEYEKGRTETLDALSVILKHGRVSTNTTLGEAELRELHEAVNTEAEERIYQLAEERVNDILAKQANEAEQRIRAELITNISKGTITQTLSAMLDEAGNILERQMKAELKKKLNRIIDSVKVRRTSSRRLVSKMRAENYRRFERIIQVMGMSAAAKDNTLGEIESAKETLQKRKIPDSSTNVTFKEIEDKVGEGKEPIEYLTELEKYERLVLLFGNIDGMSYEQMLNAFMSFKRFVSTSRALWEMKLAAEKDRLTKIVRAFIERNGISGEQEVRLKEDKDAQATFAAPDSYMNPAQLFLALSSFKGLEGVFKDLMYKLVNNRIAREKHLREMRESELRAFGRIEGIKAKDGSFNYTKADLKGKVADAFDKFFAENNKSRVAKIEDADGKLIPIVRTYIVKTAGLEVKKTVEVELTKWEALSLILQYRQDDYKKNAEAYGYTPAVMEQLEAYCGKKLMAFGNYLQNAIVNDGTVPVYEERTGVPMKENPKYFPSSANINTLNITSKEPLVNPQSGINPFGWQKQRVNHLEELRAGNAYTIYRAAIASRANYVFLEPITHTIERLLAHRYFANGMKELLGDRLFSQLKVTINEIKGAAWQETVAEDISNERVMKAFAAFAPVALAGNVTTYVKQTTAIANAGMMPNLNIINCFPQIIKAFSFKGKMTPQSVMKLDGFKTRWRDNAYVNDMISMGNNATFSRMFAAARVGMQGIDCVDIFANAFSAAIVYNKKYDSLVAKGVTESEAEKQAEQEVNLYLAVLSQPLSRMDKSAIYWRMSQNAYSKALLYMGSEAIQKVGMARALYIQNKNKGDSWWWNMVKLLAKTGTSLGIAGTLVNYVCAWIRGETPDEDDNKTAWWIATYLNAWIGQYTEFIPAAGGLVDLLLSPYVNWNTVNFDIPGLSLSKRFGKLYTMITDDKDYSPAEWDMEITRFNRELIPALTILGLGTYSTLQPASHVTATLTSLAAIANVAYPFARGASNKAEWLSLLPESLEQFINEGDTRKPRRRKSGLEILIEKAMD